jgi:hypothetical protein
VQADGVAVAVCVVLSVADDVPALFTGPGRVDGVLTGVARFRQQHDQGASAVADEGEELSSVILGSIPAAAVLGVLHPVHLPVAVIASATVAVFFDAASFAVLPAAKRQG